MQIWLKPVVFAFPLGAKIETVTQLWERIHKNDYISKAGVANPVWVIGV